eukprot:9102110-Pyramimonas_sp.AAC.1
MPGGEQGREDDDAVERLGPNYKRAFEPLVSNTQTAPPYSAAAIALRARVRHHLLRLGKAQAE